MCWGANWVGELGDGTTTDSAVPVRVNGLQSGVMGISLGEFRTCALTTQGRVYCWGAYADRHQQQPDARGGQRAGQPGGPGGV